MTEPHIPAAGEKAPDFRLPDANGQTVSLADFAGRWLVLYFYPKDNTSGCTLEAVEFTALAPEFSRLGADVAGVSKDSPSSHAKFMARHGLGVRLLSDEDKAALTAYGAWREKTMYGKKALGVVRSTFLIDPEGTVAQAWPKVAKTAGHAEAVLAALRARLGQ